MPLIGHPDHPGIRWDELVPHERQARLNHDQDLEVLRRRGGLSACEAIAILEDRPWRSMPGHEALRALEPYRAGRRRG